MSEVKERPILFQGDMVNAILEGRKTMTRQIVKRQPKGETSHARYWCEETGEWEWMYNAITAHPGSGFFCPYGKPGDRLWVRESWRTETDFDDIYSPSQLSTSTKLLFEADADWSTNKTVGRLRPSIHMPRWASRILLEITDVRIERIRDITLGDIASEGVDCGNHPGEHDHLCSKKATTAWITLWDSINGDGSWNANPYVWVVEFKRLIA